MAKKSILVIDDQQNLRDLIEYQLTIVDGHTVVMAGDGEKGLKIAQRAKPDLILLDWMLPGMEVLRHLQATPATKINFGLYDDRPRKDARCRNGSRSWRFGLCNETD